MPNFVKVAVHALIQKDGKFLVTHRSFINDYQAEKWDIPGGTIEFQEKTEMALEREVFEETNLKVKIGPIIFNLDFASGEYRHQFQLVYKCEYESVEVKLNPEEQDQFKWLTFEEIKELDNKIAFLEELSKSIN